MNDYIISPSILSANIACLGEDVAKVITAGADFIHIDVMDNHYVPNLTFGPIIVQALRDYGIQVPLDVHLMIKPTDQLIPAFAKAGASYITFHPEASEHIDRSLQLIRDNGCRSGLAFNPATPMDILQYVIDKVDMVLLMSVNPGFAGQSFIPSMLDKLRHARQIIDASAQPIRLEIDGGVKIDNIHQIAMAGADTFVSGSAIFSTDNYQSTILAMRKELSDCQSS